MAPQADRLLQVPSRQPVWPAPAQASEQPGASKAFFDADASAKRPGLAGSRRREWRQWPAGSVCRGARRRPRARPRPSSLPMTTPLWSSLGGGCNSSAIQVLRSPDSAHALMGAMKTRPDLVILDVNMPGGNGLAVCEMLASDPHYAGIPVIIHTSSADRPQAAVSASRGTVRGEVAPVVGRDQVACRSLIGGARSETEMAEPAPVGGHRAAHAADVWACAGALHRRPQGRIGVGPARTRWRSEWIRSGPAIWSRGTGRASPRSRLSW